jgi:hypothetical protein
MSTDSIPERGILMEESTSQMTKEEIDLLIYMETTQRQEIRYREERQYNIFKWSSSILLALMGALLVTKPSESLIWVHYGLTGKIMASIIVILLVVFSVQWQIRNRRFYAENGAVIQRIDYLLHYYEKGYFDPAGKVAILPENWLRDYPTPKEKINFIGRMKSFNYTSATAVLGLLTLVMIWVP